MENLDKQDRQDRQPRWTKKDDRNCFVPIYRLNVLTQRQTNKIDQLRKEVQNLRDSVTTQLESIRADIEFRGTQNIDLFTYVTFVFLPLGFAAGLLSMNGLPDHALLMNLATLSLGAL